MRIALAAALAVTMMGCGRTAHPVKAPVDHAVHSYINALRGDDPAALYRLLSENARAQVSLDELRDAWPDLARERAQRATDLEHALGGNGIEETYAVTYPDGRVVRVIREQGHWRVGAVLASQTHAGRPRDAVAALTEALAARDIHRLLAILTSRRRQAIAPKLEQLTRSLREHQKSRIDLLAEDRALLSWEDRGIAYEIVLRKEGAEWRVDDIDMHPIATPMK
ncbi:MAG TPA: hypothetical protein VFG83_12225 [Kofleriaceae bacterium]|nr:hypothetical protein [Kofleriaceae bacterium]